MTTATILISLATVSTVYAVLLELANHYRWTPDWTWLEVVIGVAMTGLFVWWRLSYPLPPGVADPETAARWVWRLWIWAFCASGAPIILWQVAVMVRAHREAHGAGLRLLEKAIRHDPSQTVAGRGGGIADSGENDGQ